MLEGLLKFPCTFQKRPLTQWNKTAKRDADIKGWQLVGVPTGSVSGFDVLDVDVAGLGWLDEVWDRLPPTRTHATRSGGRHLFFKHVDGLRNSAGRVREGVDVRADGGFVIWWPRQGLRVLSDAEIAEWPAWLLDLALGSVQVAAWQSGDGDGGMGERTHAAISTSSRVGVERTLNHPVQSRAGSGWRTKSIAALGCVQIWRNDFRGSDQTRCGCVAAGKLRQDLWLVA